MKRIIRWLYWTFAHKGDTWQHRLVVHYIPACPTQSGGQVLISEINQQNHELSLLSETVFWPLNKLGGDDVCV